MPFDVSRARPLLQSCDLPKLFVEELGWEPCHQKLTLRAGETDYAFTAVAEKRGFTAWLCEASTGGLPDHGTRLKLDRKLSETSFEHLIVFVTGDLPAPQSEEARQAGRSTQSWMWVRREPGKPLSARTHEYHRSQPGDSLLQKLQILYVSLEEEEAGLATVAVAGRARAAFDIERVTKAFYRDFDTLRIAFLKFIDGIGENADREWYASVMLNRLMFVYFIQRKGFLDGDPDYLRHRLDRCKKEQGKDKFYTFYRYFLLRLFHEGFGKRRKDRAPDLEKLLGNIPYLNGGLFDVHELEKPERYGRDIAIPDKAFERVFQYFDEYQWHLDDRPLKSDKEINPDVLGYIFEKYINQKQMGAYYTKEDITEYISKNTVLPFLFDAARTKCKVAFENPHDPTVWDLLRESPDRYIYSAVRHGADKKLPPEIAAGLDTTKPNLIERRKAWNKPAPGDYALPTEIWREVVARRQRYEEVRKKLAAGEVREVNDFITLNLDLRQFAQDVIQNCEGPDLLMAFWQAITTITVLDPTGGSGAFIFAALNILEPLYEACLDRMESFLSEWGENGRKAHPNYHKKFTEVLARVAAHPNRRYFVLKSIILNNLYAVDIMEEAVEICKLRLFLKLAAQVEPDADRDNLGIEPLPDIDFNIRAGNTLVGYATYDEVKRAVTSALDFDNAMEKIAVKAADLQQTFDRFRQLQTEGDGSVPVADKLELQKRLKALEDELNRHLAGEYGVKVSDKTAYAQWVKSHQPFHWFIQFYGILNSGGFDVIIGNPPYVECAKIRSSYQPKGLITISSGNLYGMVCEVAFKILGSSSRVGVIIPMSVVSTARMESVRNYILNGSAAVHFSHYSGNRNPSVLFEGVEMRLTICLAKTNQGSRHPSAAQAFSTEFRRWASSARDHLFSTTNYVKVPLRFLSGSLFPKLGTKTEEAILDKIAGASGSSNLGMATVSEGTHNVYAHRIASYFVKGLTFIPRFASERDGEKRSEDYKVFSFADRGHASAACCVINSSLFYLYYIVFSDAYHCGRELIEQFPVNISGLSAAVPRETRACEESLMRDLKKNSDIRKIAYKNTGMVEMQKFFPKLSKPILDEIDTVLAGHYGFTAEELDFILNYDIKYRLGRDAGDEE